MGIKLFSDGPSASASPTQVTRPNPNPWRFGVESVSQHGSLYLSVVNYPDCTTFEGRKILVTRVDPRTLLRLDPHFTEGGQVVARFEPSEEGLEMAGLFVLANTRQGRKLLRHD